MSTGSLIPNCETVSKFKYHERQDLVVAYWAFFNKLHDFVKISRDGNVSKKCSYANFSPRWLPERIAVVNIVSN